MLRGNDSPPRRVANAKVVLNNRHSIVFQRYLIIDRRIPSVAVAATVTVANLLGVGHFPMRSVGEVEIGFNVMRHRDGETLMKNQEQEGEGEGERRKEVRCRRS